MAKNQPELPEGTWPITKEDKVEIRKLGRALHKFLLDYAKANPINGKFFPWKIIAGGFEYFQALQGQKAKLVHDDILCVQDLLERFGLGEALEEPFQHVEPEEVPPTAPAETAPENAPAPSTPVEANASVDSASPAPSAPVTPAPIQSEDNAPASPEAPAQSQG